MKYELSCFNIQEFATGKFRVTGCFGERTIPPLETRSFDGAAYSAINEYHAYHNKILSLQTKGN